MPIKSAIFQQQPKWQLNRPGVLRQIPEAAASWIFEPGSLTRRLRSYYGDSFSVKILFHRWQPAFFDECRQLHLTLHRAQLIREVLLHANDEPLILARTILPHATIRVAKRNLSHLGTRPLGEVIFAYPKLERLQLEISEVNVNHWQPSIRQQLNIEQAIWGRRTVYAIHHHPLLVSELFLPGALKLA